MLRNAHDEVVFRYKRGWVYLVASRVKRESEYLL